MLASRNGICLVLLLGVLPGCVLTDGTPSEIASADRLVRQHARDLATGRLPANPPPLSAPPPLNPDPLPRLCMRPRSTAGGPADYLQQVAWVQPEPLQGQKPPQRTPTQSRFSIPPGLPGANAPPLTFLSVRLFGMSFPVENNALRAGRLNPPLPPLPPPLKLAPGPEGRPLTLDDLQRLGMQYSPAIKKARAAVDAAIGAVKDAGAYPNPNVGYEHDTVRTAVAGYEGFYIEQLIKTAGKLKLKQAAALMDLRNAEVALRRAETDLFYAIRTNYFEVLVARENARINQALAQFAENIYLVQINLTKPEAAPAAAYEPIQLRPLVYQARFNLLQARSSDLANWRQLAAALGRPDMPPTELAGTIDMALPNFDYDRVLGHILAWHTDVLTAENSIRQGQYNLALEKVNPIPDIDVRLLLQRDYTNQPFNQISPSLVAGITLPVWDQNRGKIWQMRANLAQAVANLEVTRNTLVSNLADAMNRYETSRMQVRVALQQIRDQVRVYRALYSRRQSEPAAVSFGDLVTAQQTLAGFIAGYVTALGAQWQAVTDVANLLQSNNIYDEGQPQPPSGAPPLPGRGPGVECPPQPAPQPFGDHTVLPAPRPGDGAPMPLMLPPPDVLREERPR
jgi:cobalt-zinc-cadmium efflux system outer membrane protein